MLKFFRADHRHEQIGEQQQCDDRDNDCFHCVLLQLFAEANVKSADDEEGNDNADENYIAHDVRSMTPAR